MPPSPLQSTTAISCLLIYTYPIHVCPPLESRSFKKIAFVQKKFRLSFSTDSQEKRKKKKVSTLVAVKPENQEIEKERFWKSKYAYNPQFTYKNPVTNKTLQKRGHPSKKILPIVS